MPPKAMVYSALHDNPVAFVEDPESLYDTDNPIADDIPIPFVCLIVHKGRQFEMRELLI